MFCRSLFVLLFFFFWPLCCLSFDWRILITPLESSNTSYCLLRFHIFKCFCYLFSLFSKKISKTDKVLKFIYKWHSFLMDDRYLIGNLPPKMKVVVNLHFWFNTNSGGYFPMQAIFLFKAIRFSNMCLKWPSNL